MSQELTSRFEIVSSYVISGEKALTDFIALIQTRIDSEVENMAALSKLGNFEWTANSSGSLFEAINAFQCDALNNAKVKSEFIDSLRIDVLASLTELQRNNSKVTGKLLQQGRDAIRVLKTATERSVKAAAKCDKSQREAAEAREKLMDARTAGALGGTAQQVVTPLTPSQMTKLAEQVNEKMDDAADAQIRHEEARRALLQIRQAFDVAMREVISGLETRDESRVNTMKAALRRHLVVETSFLANRQYDTQNLVSVFEEVSHENDLLEASNKASAAAVAVESTSTELASATPAAPATPASAAMAGAASGSTAAINDIDVPRAAPYISQQRRKAAQKRKPKDLVEDLTFWMDKPSSKEAGKEAMVDDFEELYLGDLIGRLVEKHDLSSLEMKKLNVTLGALKGQAPFALLRVLLHYTREIHIEMNDHAFHFFAQLLKNMLRKFLQLQDMVAAKLVSSIAENIVLLDSEDTVATLFEEEDETAPIMEWQSKFFDECETNADGYAERPEEVLQHYYSLFVDTHNVDPRQALRILSEIATANDDVVEASRFADWVQSIYLSLDPANAPAAPALPSSIANASAPRGGSSAAPVTNTVVAPATFSANITPTSEANHLYVVLCHNMLKRPLETAAHSNMSEWGRIPSASIQRIILFESHSYLYLVGGNKTRTNYRILQIDRARQDELNIVEDPVLYSYDECMARIKQLEVLHAHEGGLVRKARYQAMLGFVKFFSSYYIILVETASEVGTIAGHHIYTLREAPALIQVNTQLSDPRYAVDESRYKTLFSAMDMSRDFYFSHSFDLTNTIQHHLTGAPLRPSGKLIHGMPAYNDMFLWNYYHMQPVSTTLGEAGAKWVVPLVHGFFAQSCFNINERSVRLSLMSRRSRHFAGTRYIKRGMDPEGHVANEVETEQILQVQSSWLQGHGSFSSCVVMRGSIPLFWSQENPMAPAPAVIIDRTAPAVQQATTKAHLLDLFTRYGPAVFMLNLIRLNQAQETPLGLEFSKCVGMMRHALNSEASSWWQGEGRQTCQNLLRLNATAPTKATHTVRSFQQCEACQNGLDPHESCQCEMPSSWARVGPLTQSGTSMEIFPLGRKRSEIVRINAAKTQEIKSSAPSVGSTLEYCYRCTGLPAWSKTSLVSSLQSDAFAGASEVALPAEGDAEPAEVPSGPLLPSSVLYQLHYVAYDFLQQMKETGLVVEEISKIVQPMLECTSHFVFVPPTGKGHALHAMTNAPSVRRTQRGVVRVNCVDCLDRTNVAQYCVIKSSLRDQLADLGFNDERLEVEAFPELVENLQNLFYAQGDRIANQYGGSEAMHKEALSTATTTGTAVAAVTTAQTGQAPAKRSGSSFVTNAMTSIKRYYNNNFADHGKQHSMNVFLGNFIPDPTKPNIWELDAGIVRTDVDKLFGVPVGNVDRALALAQAQQLNMLHQVLQNGHQGKRIELNDPSLKSEFNNFFEEAYSPADMTSFDELLELNQNRPIAVRKVNVAEASKSRFSLEAGGSTLTTVPEGQELSDSNQTQPAIVITPSDVDPKALHEPFLTPMSVYSQYVESSSDVAIVDAEPSQLLNSTQARELSLLQYISSANRILCDGVVKSDGASGHHNSGDAQYFRAEEPEESLLASSEKPAEPVSLSALDLYWNQVEQLRDLTSQRLEKLNNLLVHRGKAVVSAPVASNRRVDHKRANSLMNHVREEYVPPPATSHVPSAVEVKPFVPPFVTSAEPFDGEITAPSPLNFPRHRLSLGGPSLMSSLPSLMPSTPVSAHSEVASPGFFTSLTSMFSKK